MQTFGRSPYATLSKRPDFVPPRPDDDTDSSDAVARSKGMTGKRATGKDTKLNGTAGKNAKAKNAPLPGKGGAIVRRPPPGKRGSPGKSEDTREPERMQPAADVLARYPDAVQLAQRFLLLEQRADEIDRKPRDQLSIDDGLTLREYDAVRDRLAFLREDATPPQGDPVAMSRLPPAGPTRPPPAQAAATQQGDDDVPQVRYVGGVRIRSDYSLKDVLGTTANALKAPFGSFIASTRDLVKKATEGVAITSDEEQQVYQYAQIVESFLSLSAAGRVQQAAGAAVATLNAAIDGESQTPQEMVDNIGSVRALGAPLPGAAPGTSGIVRKPPAPVQLKKAQVPAPKESLHVFDFPRFRIPFVLWSRNLDAQSAFKPPTRLPTGQVGYPLSPTRPPKLPSEEPAATGAQAREQGGASTVSAGRTEESAQAGTSSGRTEEDAPAGTSSAPEREASEATSSCPPVGSGCIGTSRSPVAIENADLRGIAGKGPINVEVPAGPDEDQRRINAFDASFLYYRKDKDITNMPRGRPLRETKYDARRDVLVVGDGSDVTSYVADSKVAMGQHWGPEGTKLAENISVIQLNNGRDGVGALKLRFADIPRGSSVVVTGGAMNGCTMLFASDGHSLYAYHAGTSSQNANWHTAREGAHSIVEAHETVGPHSTSRYNWQDNNSDLVVVGRQYPFSALIYSGRLLGNTDAVAGMGAMAGAVVAPRQTVPNAELHVRRHEFGPRTARRWHMMTFNYHGQDPKQYTVGTAAAVVSRGLDGAVTLRVLAEKGHLDRRTSIGERGDTIAYRYKPDDSDSASYWVPHA